MNGRRIHGDRVTSAPPSKSPGTPVVSFLPRLFEHFASYMFGAFFGTGKYGAVIHHVNANANARQRAVSGILGIVGGQQFLHGS